MKVEHHASASPSISVVIPCLNEAACIGEVIDGFREALPKARILVVDNASTDETAAIAAAHGADVIRETRRGKGFALLAGIREASPSDVFIMVDGDGTYPSEAVHKLIACIEDGADVAIGTRLQGAGAGAFPVGHSWGNRLFITIVRILFGIRTQDLFSGYRALTSRFLQQCPLIAQGFEIEAELSIQAVTNHFRVDEVPVEYSARTGDSVSKLRTFRDGYRILLVILAYFRDYRPLTFFGSTGLLFLITSVATGSLVISNYIATGQVLRLPLAVLASGLFILGSLSFAVGVLLSSMNRRTEEIRSLLLSQRD